MTLVSDAGTVEPPRSVRETAAASSARPAKKTRRENVDLAVRLEGGLDFAALATLADEGFGFAPGTFRAERLRWLYETGFSDGTTVLGAYAGERKVGHLALVHHTLSTGQGLESAVALMDLFILPAFRSKAAIAGLYGRVESLCKGRGIRFIVAMPNEKAAPVNRRHLGLTDRCLFDIRVGMTWALRPGWRRVTSRRIADLGRDEAIALLDPYCDGTITGLHWTGARLWDRLQKPDAGYAIHANDRVLAVSAPRTDWRAPCTLICALMPKAGATVRRRDVRAVVAAACRMQGKPLFLYTGLNEAVPRPGLPLPRRLRPSQMILQMRDFAIDADPVEVARFESLDFDFC